MAKLAAIVLAAGASRRYGPENKLLAAIGGQPLVRCVAKETLAGGVGEVVVVTGCDAPQIERALAGVPVRLVPNVHWESGMGSSIAAGVRALGEDIEGAFIVLGDMPFLSAVVLRSLASAFEGSKGRAIVYPATPDGVQRNPVLWPRRYFAELGALAGAEGAKELIRAHADESIPVMLESVSLFADIDTPADLTAAQNSLGGGRS
jgi:molybdenum cofactor cytidylyltransferase